MALTKITEADLVNKGVVGLPDTPALSTMEMQEKFDEIALDVIVPKHNGLIDELEDLDVEHKVSSEAITNIRTNADMAIEVSTDGGETYVGTASSGHRIEDGNGYIYPNRSRLQFSSNVTITDNPEGNATFLSVANGEKGDKGDAATIAIGTVQSGVTPAVTNTGSNTDAIFNFTFPKGDDGNAATVQVGTVSSGASASVTNRGTSSAAIFDFVLPKGDQGDPGTGLTILGTYATLADLQSAHPTGQRGDAYFIEANSSVYIWDVDNLAWEDIGEIKGAKGDTGSAATITVGTVTTGATASVVNSGTTSAAVLDFVLQKGDKGDTGNTGTIAVGTVTSGTTASVTNSGTTTAAVFDFVLPKGDKGDKGDPGNPILPHFKITADHGATVSLIKGAMTIAAVETSSGMYEADVPEYGTYTVSSVYSGVTTTTTVDVDTVKVYTANVVYISATIAVTYTTGGTCTCVGEGESYTATTNPYTFTVHHLGTYTISVEYGGETVTQSVVITTNGQSESISLGEVTYTVTLHGAPEATITFYDATLTLQTHTLDSNGEKSNVDVTVSQNNPYVTFVDSDKSKVPEKLDEPYFRRYEITSATTDIYVTPENALYWWGYESSDLEDVTTANGWSRTSYTLNAPTHNKNSITCTGANNTYSNVGTKTSKSGVTMYVVATGTTAASNRYGDLAEYSSKSSLSQQVAFTYIEQSAMTKYSLSVTNGYVSTGSAQVRKCDLYGFWYITPPTTPTYYSAACDVIYIKDTSDNVIPIAYTDAEGKSYDAISLPNGTYTIYSSVAKNPDNLSEPFSKSVTITSATTDIEIFPVAKSKMLYWYGYQSDNLEIMSTANGWPALTSTGSYTEPTFNKNNITLTTNANTFGGIGTKNSVPSASKWNMISVNSVASKNTALQCSDGKATNTNMLRLYATNTSIEKTVLDDTYATNRYGYIYNIKTSMTMTLSAFWYE